MYIYVIFNPNQEKKPQGNKVVQYFKNLNSVISEQMQVIGLPSGMKLVYRKNLAPYLICSFTIMFIT